jgi:hypothetical protein
MERERGIMRGARVAVLLCLAVALVGCQRRAAPDIPEEETQVFTRPADMPLFTLEPIDPYEVEDYGLEGDKRCAFSTHPAVPPLVVATGFLRRPQASVDVLVKYGGQLVDGTSVTPGGFDGIRQEARFDTAGMVIDVARIAVEPDGSGPAAPGRALLRMTMAGQDEQIIEGFWICSV